MKKVLALILAVLMLASLAIAAVAAEDEKIDYINFWFNSGKKNIYLGSEPIEAAPILDGEISEGEYMFERKFSVGDQDLVLHDADYTEYMAYDEDYFYYAFTTKMLADKRAQFQYRLDDIKLTVDEWNNDTSNKIFNRGVIRFTYEDVAGLIKKECSQNAPGFTAPAWDNTLFLAGTRDLDTQINVFEFKLSMDIIQPDKSVPAILSYIIYLGGNDSGDNWVYDVLTDEQKLERVDAGVTQSTAWTYFHVFFEDAPEGYYTTTEATTTEATTTAAATTTAKPATTTAKAADATTTAAATTTAKAADATTEAADEEKSGCGSSLAISALVMIPTLAGGVILTSKKRKED